MTDLDTLSLTIRKAQKGDRDAFGKLYDLFLNRLYRFIYYKVTNRETAEDITEQVFVKMFEKLPTYKETGLPFEAWLFRVARNQVIDFYRTRKHTVSLEKVMEVPDVEPSLIDRVHTTMTMDMVKKALVKLHDSYREILILKFIEDKGNEEISVIVNKPVAHVRVLQSRAIAALRKHVYDTYKQ